MRNSHNWTIPQASQQKPAYGQGYQEQQPAYGQGYQSRQQAPQPSQRQQYTAPQAPAEPAPPPQAPMQPAPPPQAPMQPAPASQTPTQQNRQNNGGTPEYISRQIAKVNGRDKILEFCTNLSAATVADFAMVHGCGGKGHAYNSTICVRICDYSKGTGDKSVTLKYGIDVDDMEMLYQAAMKSRLGSFFPPASGLSSKIQAALAYAESLTKGPVTQDGRLVVAPEQVGGLMERLQTLLNDCPQIAGVPLFSYEREKVDPYKKDGNGMAPVSKLAITYTPVRLDNKTQHAERSRYPWFISITNFMAPLLVGDNGNTTYNGQKAANKRTVFLVVSEDDFCSAMVACRRHIRLWEQAMTLPVMEEAFRQIENQRQNPQQ